ncbi:MAG: hypothetical protein A3J79_04415 [Elusimicrobia bacterium RIFOXYB2_FULL_62_6]|nr:MAG: hypothetical protein A3J79_04415 [Elusimicrobia bacterium RIFOXYB2_FULL_62_6]
MKVRIIIQIAGPDGEPFMGFGVVCLLERIKKLRSINLAAKDMRMSYAKAHHILKSLEKHLGRKMLIRRRGGADRGGAELTTFADNFLARYAEYRAGVKKYAEKEFSGFLKSLKARKA